MLSPTKREYQRIMKDNLAGELSSTRVLSYQAKPSGPPDSHSNNLKILYSASKSQQSTKKVARHIPQAPERILDAPDIINDYYLNLVDWSSNNHLAVALGAHVYLWNAASGDIHQLCQLGGEEDYVASYLTATDQYREGAWQGMVTTMETALQLYLAAEESCRLSCDKPFDMGW